MTLVAEGAAPEPLKRRALTDRAVAWLPMFILVIVVWPLTQTIRLSFANATLGGETWVRIARYAALFGDPRSWQTMARTVYGMALAVSLKLILGRIGANLLDAAIPGKARFCVRFQDHVALVAISRSSILNRANPHCGTR